MRVGQRIKSGAKSKACDEPDCYGVVVATLCDEDYCYGNIVREGHSR